MPLDSDPMSLTHPEKPLKATALSPLVNDIPLSFLRLSLVSCKNFVYVSAIEPDTLISNALKGNHDDVGIIISSENVFVRIDNLLRKTVANLIKLFLATGVVS
jgi:hypothetical protein